jgi:hypothetical protein
VPTTYTKSSENPYPLILAFHGITDDENFILDFDIVKTLAEERGYIIVAPRGLGSDSPDYMFSSWTVRGAQTGVDGT